MVFTGTENYKLSHNYIYILSVYSLFSDKVGLPLHNTPFPGVLMKSIGAVFFDRICNNNFMQLCFNLKKKKKIVLDKLASRSHRLLVPWREHLSRCERLIVAKGLNVL